MSSWLTLKQSNCKNCHKCIRHCPVKAIRFSGNQAYIIGNECILCGQCYVVCPQNAKEVVSEIEKVKVMLHQSDPVIVSIAPSFVANYPNIGINGINKALKQLGFSSVEETAIGATIVKKEYERMLKEEEKKIIITSCCHSVNLLIQKYFPKSLEYLANVVSPMQAHALDIKKRIPNAKVVFVGPCIAKKDEAEHYSGIVDAVLTFEELSELLKQENITLEQSEENTDKGLARFFPTAGGVLKTLIEKNPKYTYIAIDGIENCIEALRDIEDGNVDYCFIEMNACKGSCIGGPIMTKTHHTPIKDYMLIEKYAGGIDFEVDQLDKSNIHKYFESIAKRNTLPTDDEIRMVLRQMGKFTPAQELNCGSCGYNTCREKSIAILQGKAELSMCLPYLKDRSEKLSDNIANNITSGLVVLNEQLEVQQINKEACRIMNIRSAKDVLGSPVIRILDPLAFLDVLDNRKTFKNKEVYLAEYQKYVEQTIVYDKEFHLLMCILRDITEEKESKHEKEELSKKTIEVADKVVEKQMRIVQEIASLLGETAAETKIALTKLKESIKDE